MVYLDNQIMGEQIATHTGNMAFLFIMSFKCISIDFAQIDLVHQIITTLTELLTHPDQA